MLHLLFKLLFVAFFCSLQALAAEPALRSIAPLPRERATLELHAHLFMKEGMTWAFKGDFDGPLRAQSWKDRFSSQANPESMNDSEAAVVVVALYAHPLFTISLRDSIRRQIALAEKFVAEHPEWSIARTASQARDELAQGKRVLILALEGASGVIENEEDLKEFIDEKGIRIVNLLHLSDDEFGGVALMSGYKALSSPLNWLAQLFFPNRDGEGYKVNTHGLSDRGRAMAQSLIARHVWLDLAHASDLSQVELVRLMKGLPLLYTHTTLRKYMGAERGINAEQLELVHQSGGELGLMPSDDMLGETAVLARFCKPECKDSCQSGMGALEQQYFEITQTLSPDQVAFGSDYNGGVHHLPPVCGASGVLGSKGLYNISSQHEVWDELEKQGLPVPPNRSLMIDHFLAAWDKIGAHP